MKPIRCLFGRHLFGSVAPYGTKQYYAQKERGVRHPQPPASFGLMERFCSRCGYQDGFQEEDE